jgi:hypothetical protein
MNPIIIYQLLVLVVAQSLIRWLAAWVGESKSQRVAAWVALHWVEIGGAESLGRKQRRRRRGSESQR